MQDSELMAGVSELLQEGSSLLSNIDPQTADDICETGRKSGIGQLVMDMAGAPQERGATSEDGAETASLPQTSGGLGTEGGQGGGDGWPPAGGDAGVNAAMDSMQQQQWLHLAISSLSGAAVFPGAGVDASGAEIELMNLNPRDTLLVRRELVYELEQARKAYFSAIGQQLFAAASDDMACGLLDECEANVRESGENFARAELSDRDAAVHARAASKLLSTVRAYRKALADGEQLKNNARQLDQKCSPWCLFTHTCVCVCVCVCVYVYVCVCVCVCVCVYYMYRKCTSTD